MELEKGEVMSRLKVHKYTFDCLECGVPVFDAHYSADWSVVTCKSCLRKRYLKCKQCNMLLYCRECGWEYES